MRRETGEKENCVRKAFSQHNGCLFNSATTVYDLPPVFRSVRASWNAFVSPSVLKKNSRNLSQSPFKPRNLFPCLKCMSPMVNMDMVDMDLVNMDVVDMDVVNMDVVDIDVVDMEVVCLFQRNDKASYNIAKNSIFERT